MDSSGVHQRDSGVEEDVVVCQMPKTTHNHVLGLVLAVDACTELDAFLAHLVLSGMNVDVTIHDDIVKAINVHVVTESVVDLFDARLRYAAKDDKWLLGGRDVFREQVGGFTARGARIEFCLPAFPCKSSNTDKVLSTSPDRGEYMALCTLHAFLAEIEALYEPGAKLWIISDGHVFSDCSRCILE
jgi:hypothetical protein